MPSLQGLDQRKAPIERAITDLFVSDAPYEHDIFEAMRYSMMAGGKRLRPILLLEAYKLCGGSKGVLPFALALEMIHTYSLIHDDLPAMDNDDLRRGKPTNHVVFGEGMAILAGDALLNYAFETMLKASLNSETPYLSLKAMQLIAQASGVHGMIGGQVMDLKSEDKEVPFETLDYIHTHKTGALLVASLHAGAVLANADLTKIEALTRYGYHIGLAFQIADDILDIEGDQQKLGKTIGSDIDNHKTTYPSLFGLEQAKVKAKTHVDQAKKALIPFERDADFLLQLADFIINREH